MAFFLRELMRSLHPDRGSIYIYEKKQKVSEVCLIRNDALKEILTGLRRLREYLHILGAYRCIDFPVRCRHINAG